MSTLCADCGRLADASIAHLKSVQRHWITDEYRALKALLEEMHGPLFPTEYPVLATPAPATATPAAAAPCLGALAGCALILARPPGRIRCGLPIADGVALCALHMLQPATHRLVLAASEMSAAALESGAVAELVPTFVNSVDAPSCHACGALMVRSGSCYKCHNCGSTSGCS